MKVKDLIEELKKYDPELEIFTEHWMEDEEVAEAHPVTISGMQICDLEIVEHVDMPDFPYYYVCFSPDKVKMKGLLIL